MIKKLDIPRFIGHRGLKAYAPENTLASIRKAHELGLTWVELDVMRAKDGEFVIFHDKTLRRTTDGRGSLHRKTGDQLKLLDAGFWFSPKFLYERIPTLKEALTCIIGLGLHVNLELKPRLGHEKKFAEDFLKVMGQSWPQHLPPPLISSFSYRVLKYLSRFQCAYPLAWLLSKWKRRWQRRADELNCVSINLDYILATPDHINAIKQTGRTVLCYTINDLVTAERLFDMGVDGIFTDMKL